MIQRLSHVTLFVNNQDEAKDFYVNKLGFEVRTDHTMDNGFRWLTVGPQSQPELEIVLMEPKAGPMLDEEAHRPSGCSSRKACWDPACSRSMTAARPTTSCAARAFSLRALPRSASTASKRS